MHSQNIRLRPDYILLAIATLWVCECFVEKGTTMHWTDNVT